MKGFALQWHVTNRCDQRCKHCYIYNGQEVCDLEPSLEECNNLIGDFVRFCKRIGRRPFFTITGGDPLLYPDIWALFEMLHEKGLRFAILGNPFHLDEGVCKKLKELGCTDYQMSLDGMQETHDSFRKKGSWDSTLSALELIGNAGIKTVIMTTVSKANYKEVPDIIRTVVEHKVNRYAFARYCPTHGDVQDNIPALEYRDFLSEIWKLHKELENKGTVFKLKDHLWKPYLIEEGLMKINGNGNKIHQGCHCGISHLTLLPDGTVYACRRFESPIGNIKEKSFYKLFFGMDMHDYRDVKQIDGCKDCELLYHCRGCRAVAYGTSNSFFSKDPQCWRCS